MYSKHLTVQQRYEISFRLQNKERPTDIEGSWVCTAAPLVEKLGATRHPMAGIMRKRPSGCQTGEYRAQESTIPSLRTEIKVYIDHKLTQEQWSPEQISGSTASALGLPTISHEPSTDMCGRRSTNGESLSISICATGASCMVTSAVHHISQGNTSPCRDREQRPGGR